MLQALLFKFSLVNYFAATCAKGSILGFPTWYKYLNVDQTNCAVQFVFPNDILAVGLAIIDILLRLAGIVAVISIIVAGIGYITALGSSDKVTAARNRIINAVTGLIIVIIASAVVSFIGNKIG